MDRVTESKMGDVKLWAPDDLSKPRSNTPKEKFEIERVDQAIAEKNQRSATCWELGCEKQCHVWVHEVQFDMKDEKATPLAHPVVSSKDYDGPAPGFCIGHIANGPANLAQAVYFDSPQIQWGLIPSRYWVSFTDGSKTGGPVQEINLNAKVQHREEHIRGE